LNAVSNRFKVSYQHEWVCGVGVVRLDPMNHKYVKVEHQWNLSATSNMRDRSFLVRLRDGDIVLYHGEVW
jgi:hypothetical protein